jgi:hypothetical protein
MKRINARVIEEAEYGIYVWEMPNGQWVGDDDGNFLSIAAMRNDRSRIEEISKAVRYYGINDGKPVFLSGHRKIDDEEFATQQQRQMFGLIPDEYDIPALVSEQFYEDKYDK